MPGVPAAHRAVSAIAALGRKLDVRPTIVRGLSAGSVFFR